jgi:hypothetical protein
MHVTAGPEPESAAQAVQMRRFHRQKKASIRVVRASTSRGVRSLLRPQDSRRVLAPARTRCVRTGPSAG